MKKTTIIFDLDGTLLNSLDDLHTCINNALAKYGYPTRTKEEIKSFVGNGIKNAFIRALPERVKDSEVNKIINYFRLYYKNNMQNLTNPYDGVIELLKKLKSNGYKLAIVSNKYNDEVNQLSEKFFGNLIDIAVGEGDGIKRKPNIDGVLKAVKSLNSNISETIFVGDSDVDILTAKNANIECISVLWGYRKKEFLIEKGATIFAETPKDIEKILCLS